jgi:hypothetical protein
MPKTTGTSSKHKVVDHHRGARRYEIDLSLRYAVRRQGHVPITGTGKSVNLSSTGILFQCESKLQAGDSIVAALDWPLAANGEEPLYLLLGGYIVRVAGFSAAISISRSELLRSKESRNRLELISKWAGRKITGRRPVLRHTALVDEDDQSFAVISAILKPNGWTVERAEPKSARTLLDASLPPVGLLITRTVDLLDGLDPDIPVILTLEEGVPEPPPELSRPPLLAIVQKPLIDGMLRKLILRFGAAGVPLAKQTSA